MNSRHLFLSVMLAIAVSGGTTLKAQTFVSDPTWVKHSANPVLGGPELGTCFDVNIIAQGKAKYNMYFSWRPQKSIALSYSDNGTQWTDPVIVLSFDETSGWEDDLNRSCTLYYNGKYHMWYTGQARGYSKIGYAISDDGIHFERVQKEPVMVPQFNYEGFSVMNPYVIRDEQKGVFRMYYASGETYEPNVLCVAESTDGIHWERSLLNPIFVHGGRGQWDQDRVGGCEVHRQADGSYVMFYIGYYDIDTARIGAAVSPDGLTQWKRLSTNPLVQPEANAWDASACYKPSVWQDKENNRWMLWYNGRNQSAEYVGFVTRQGLQLK